VLNLKNNLAVEYRLGHEVPYNGKQALVTRIVNSTALFETRRLRYSVTELYVELLTEQGEIAFVELKREKNDLPLPPGVKIVGPEPILWKDEDQAIVPQNVQYTERAKEENEPREVPDL